MLASIEDLDGALRCPLTGKALKFENGRVSMRTAADASEPCDFPVAREKPVLIDFANSVIRREDLETTNAESAIARPRYSFATRLIKSLLSPEKKSTRRNVCRLISELKRRSDRPRVLVIGGGSEGQGMKALYADPDVKIFAFDIYSTPQVQFVADAHDIPIVDGYFDGVVVQAVLEHVLEPQRVADEIRRVLKPGGLVYAETPFMQQVHEGAYDFTRFTESGHRYLFRRFALIDSGSSGGPGRQLMWAVDYFARSVFRSRSAGKIAKLAFFWAVYFDAIIPPDYAIDGASGVYFLGTKSDQAVGPDAIIAHYGGAQ